MPGGSPSLRSYDSLPRCWFFLICFELAQCRHGGRGGVFAVAVFGPSFGFAGVMILSHVCLLLDWRFDTDALTSLRDNRRRHSMA